MKTHLILGTAGHIDHGKTSLIRALTGTDTDRLPEEKKRGITIEPGYAVLEIEEFRFGIVDVPGHEKFVRQMLSGATGMDLVMLVIAADDSVKRQTVEHFDILRLLNLSGGVIALTKCDLVERDWLELVIEEIRELVRGTFLAESAIVPVSSQTGAGLDELRSELLRVARQVQQTSSLADPSAPFRMAIDRVFTMEGHGTVVTGSVSSGSSIVGDRLEIQPGAIEARVREIQNHDLAVESIARGQRGAINLAGVHHAQIRRGQELCSIGHLRPARIISVNLVTLPGNARPLKDRQRVRFHVGTSEVLAGVRLLDRREVSPGDTVLAQLFLSEPVVAVWNQPFVIRSESPMETIGGGRVLHPNASRLRGVTEETLEMLGRLADANPRVRIESALYFDGLANHELGDLARIAGVAAADGIVSELVTNGDVVEISLTQQRSFFVHRRLVNRVAEQIAAWLEKYHQMDTLSAGVSRKILERHFAFLPAQSLFDLAMSELEEDERIQVTGELVSLAGHGPQLTANERKLLVQIVERLAAAGLEPPSIEELQKEASKARNSVPQLVQLAVDQGQLVRLDDKIYLHADTVEEIKGRLRNIMKNGAGITMSDLRQHLNTSRKYAIPLCEHLDEVGFTRREGDLRYLAGEPEA